MQKLQMNTDQRKYGWNNNYGMHHPYHNHPHGVFQPFTTYTLPKAGQLQGDQPWTCIPCPNSRFLLLLNMTLWYAFTRSMFNVVQELFWQRVSSNRRNPIKRLNIPVCGLHGKLWPESLVSDVETLTSDSTQNYIGYGAEKWLQVMLFPESTIFSIPVATGTTVSSLFQIFSPSAFNPGIFSHLWSLSFICLLTFCRHSSLFESPISRHVRYLVQMHLYTGPPTWLWHLM